MKYFSYNNSYLYILLGIIIFLFFGGFNLIWILFWLPIAIILNFFPFVLFLFLGYLLIKSIQRNNYVSDFLKFKSQDHQRFVELVIRIIVQVINADKQVDSREIQVVLDYFRLKLNFSNQQILWVSDLIKDGLKNQYSLPELCQEFSLQFKNNEKLILLELVYNVAFSDQVFHPQEEEIIDKIVQLLGISASDHLKIKSFFKINKTKSTKKEEYYNILGISENATPDEIKKAYRQACKTYHPDKVQHLGEEFKKMAEEKMQIINNAYHVLTKEK